MKNNIRKIREAKGLSPEDFSKNSGLSLERIFDIEDGRYTPSLSLALKICKELGCDVSEVFPEEGSTKSIRKPLIFYTLFSIAIFFVDLMLFETKILHLKIILLLTGPIILLVKPLYNMVQKQVDNELYFLNKGMLLVAVSISLLSFMSIWPIYGMHVETVWAMIYISSSFWVYYYALFSKK